MGNIETGTTTLAQNSQHHDKVMAGLENLTGGGDNHGEIAEAAEAIRLADNLDKRTDEISTWLAHFSNSGLKEYEAFFAVYGRRTLAELQKVRKNIDEHPSRLIFGH